MDRFRRLVGRPSRRVNRATSFKAGRMGLAGAAALALGLGVAACGGDSSDSSSGQVNLVAYSTPESVYDGALIPGFEKTPEGGDATFRDSFGRSGDQQRAVIAGQPAHYVHLSLEPDMQALVDAGIVDGSWADNKYKGIVQNSVVVFAVRKGNPENIQTWDDVVRSG